MGADTGPNQIQLHVNNIRLPPARLRQAEAIVERLSAQRKSAPKIIVIFGVGSHGDSLQITPLLRNLRKQFADATLVLIHESGAVQNLLGDTGLLDLILRGSPEIFQLVYSAVVQLNLCDLVVVCRYVIQYAIPDVSSLNEDEKAFVAKALVAQKPWMPLVARFPLDNDYLWRAAAEHGLNMYSLMAHTAGFAGEDFESLHLPLKQSDFAVRKTLPERYFVVCNSAEPLVTIRSSWTKTMPREKMEGLVGKLTTFGLPAVLVGIATDPPIDGVDYDLRGRSTLREAAAILKDAAFWVAPEGGIANLAKGVGRKGIVFFCSTPPEFFAFRDNINVLPRLCGSCWWSTSSYLYHCPMLHRVAECGKSIEDQEIIEAAAGLLA